MKTRHITRPRISPAAASARRPVIDNDVSFFRLGIVLLRGFCLQFMGKQASFSCQQEKVFYFFCIFILSVAAFMVGLIS